MTQIKICGINDTSTALALNQLNVDFAGLVFYNKSPRFVDFDTASEIIDVLDENIKKVALFVDPSDDELNDALLMLEDFDIIQLHGQETPQRVADIHNNTQKPIIKACSITSMDDIKASYAYENVADFILLDAPKNKHGHEVSNMIASDILKQVDYDIPWILAGGINIDNVKQIIENYRVPIIDVSSSLEKQKGIKDIALIERFVSFVNSLNIPNN